MNVDFKQLATTVRTLHQTPVVVLKGTSIVCAVASTDKFLMLDSHQEGVGKLSFLVFFLFFFSLAKSIPAQSGHRV